MPRHNRGIFLARCELLFHVFFQIPGSDFRPVHIALMIHGYAKKKKLPVASVRLWETPTSFATYLGKATSL